MTWGIQITNANGAQMQYGTEAIPACIHAFRASLVNGDNYIDTGVPYTEDISTFVSCEHNTHASTPYLQLVNYNGQVRIIARLLAIRSAASGTFRIYMVGRIPSNVTVSGHGIALWGSDGALKFYSDYPPAPIDPITQQGAGQYPYIGIKKAVWAMPAGTSIAGSEGIPGGGEFWHYVHLGIWHNRQTGYVGEGCTNYARLPIPPSGGWGDRWAYTLISMDTTDADARFFGD